MDRDVAQREAITGSFSIRSESDGRVRRNTPSGELDVATAAILRREFEVARDDAAARMIVMGLGQLTFIDSTGVGVLLQMSAACAESDRLRVINASRTVERLIDLMGVRHRLPIMSTGSGPLAPLRSDPDS